MLGKEWLTAYLASRPRPAHSHALLRQARLEGLEHWWALHIIALLPSLLHASLFLFAVGLVIYLWTLDTVVAGVLAVVIGVTSLFYIVTAVLGAIYDHCPFVTQVSGYIKLAHGRYLRRQTLDEDRSNITTVEDLQALLWLANNARDPAVVDSSFHALAGLHRQGDQALTSDSAGTRASPNDPRQTSSRLPMQINSETTMVSLFYTVAERFEKAATNPRMSSVAGGANLARYAAAVVWLFDYIRPLTQQVNTNTQSNRRGPIVSGELGSISGDSLPISKSMSLPSSEYVLRLLENLWSNESPSFTANSYAGFLITEMELLRVAALFPTENGGTPDKDAVETPFSITAGLATIARDAHIVDIVTANPRPSRFEQIETLRACYSRTLCRTSYLIWMYSEQRIAIDASLLIRLLDVMRASVGCESLNPHHSISTHHPQRNTNGSSSFRMGISAARSNQWSVTADNLKLGPLGSLINLLRMTPETAEESLLRVRTAALETISVLAPVLLQQLLQLDRAELQEDFNFHLWSGAIPTGMQGVRYIAVRQIFAMVRHLGPNLLTTHEHPEFCAHALDTVFAYIKEGGPDFDGARLALRNHAGDLVPLLELAGASDFNFYAASAPVMFYMVEFSRYWDDRQTTICETILPPSVFPTLIRMAGPAEIAASGPQEMLQSMVTRIRKGPAGPRSDGGPVNLTPSAYYLDCFTCNESGFLALSKNTAEGEKREVIIDAIVDFVHLAATPHEVDQGFQVELRTPAVPGFLEAVYMVAKHFEDCSKHREMIVGFSRDVCELLEQACNDPESNKLVAQHPAPNELCYVLEPPEEKEVGLERLDLAKRLRNVVKVEEVEWPVAELGVAGQDENYLDWDNVGPSWQSVKEGNTD
ncbi:hypothetical protein BDV93DRAFT_608279 [Ceratobasidium sp. AG-I]|nr:hypothetical protein BDV93DRAFT_608279 [Ceratobasidium sp. AG-I]